MSRYTKHKRHQYNVGKPFQVRKPNKESFLNDEYLPRVKVPQDEHNKSCSLSLML